MTVEVSLAIFRLRDEMRCFVENSYRNVSLLTVYQTYRTLQRAFGGR
jgi:hypothetical protein